MHCDTGVGLGDGVVGSTEALTCRTKSRFVGEPKLEARQSLSGMGLGPPLPDVGPDMMVVVTSRGEHRTVVHGSDA
ncbi:hypothetical protein Hjap01_03610 [Haloarcula japonica]